MERRNRQSFVFAMKGLLSKRMGSKGEAAFSEEERFHRGLKKR